MRRIAFLLLAVCTPLAADDTAARRTVSVSAQSEIWVAPDIAVLYVSLTNSDATLAVAKQANDGVARSAARVIEDHQLNGDQYKLTDLQIGPRLSGRVVVGYTVERSLEFRLTDFSKIDRLIANLVEACGDALRVESLQFRVADQRRHQVEARRLAVEYAREKAEHLAALNGMALGHAVSIHEGVEYNSSTDGFGGFGGGFLGGDAGVSIDRPRPDVAQTELPPAATGIVDRAFVGIEEPAPAAPVDTPDPSPAPDVKNANGVEQRLLTAVGQVHLNAAVTIEWELAPRID